MTNRHLGFAVAAGEAIEQWQMGGDVLRLLVGTEQSNGAVSERPGPSWCRARPGALRSARKRSFRAGPTAFRFVRPDYSALASISSLRLSRSL